MKVERIVKQWRYPEATERQLCRSFQDVAKAMTERMKLKTKSMRFDATDEEITSAEDDLRSYGLALLLAAFSLLPMVASTIYKFNSKQWLIVAISAGGKDNPEVALLKQRGALGLEPWYQSKLGAWQSGAEAAYRKFVDDIISDWSSKIRNATLHSKDEKQVKEIVNKRYKVYSSWSVNRARGVVNTWNSVLMKQRILDAGVTSYVWRGWLDERERLQHVRWEGKEIGIETDHVFPGEPYGCRCWAEPKFS